MDNNENVIDPKDFSMDKILQIEDAIFYKCVGLKADTKYLYESFTKRLDTLSREERRDLRRCIQIASKLNHPSILKFFGYNIKKFQLGIFYEYTSENTLNKAIEPEKDKNVHFESNWNDTKILINLYGIASGMSYLHKHNIMHRDLTPENISLDKNNYPKIYNFHISKEITANSKKDIKIKGTAQYLAPETITSLEYSEKSDVYAYSLIAYEMLSKKRVSKGKRPLIISEEFIPKCYKELIERCWSENPNDRPTFSEILTELRTNKEFITESIDSDEYQHYIELIDEYNATFEPQNLHQLDEGFDLLRKKDLSGRLDSDLGFLIDPKEFTLKDFFLIVKLSSSDIYNSYKVQKKNTNDIFFRARVYSFEIRFFLRDQIVDFCREMNIMLQLNHPSILKITGISFEDFNEIPKPVVIFQNLNWTLAEMIESKYTSWDETKILINIYGIAAGMSYLHQHNIVHRDLKTENIYLDESKYPRISGFHLSKEIKRDEDKISQHLKGTPAYISPETYTKHIYDEKSDVYSYSFIIYELISNHRAFDKSRSIEEHYKYIVEEHQRPNISDNIPDCYRTLIERCWSEDPNERPTFSDILIELRTNPEFINDSIDSTEYEQYIKQIDDYPTTFEPNKRNSKLDEIIKTSLSTFNNVIVNFPTESIYSTNTTNIPLRNEYFDMKDFEYISEEDEKEEEEEEYDDMEEDAIDEKAINQSKLCFRIRKVRNISTGKFYILKEHAKNRAFLYKHDVINFFSSLKIILQLNHPSILKFIGFYPTGFKILPTVISEYAPNGTLDKMVDNESNHEWNNTKILINIYGIAAGMSYLHQHNIVHRDLKTENIYLDESKYPRISGFHLSKEIKRDGDKISQHLKGTPAYISPETYTKHIYDEKSDVYSYSFIIYELISNHRAFDKSRSIEEHYKYIVEEHQRPNISDNIPDCYRTLIERCWSEDPNERPTFSDILIELRTNPEFINDSIDSTEYEQYIKQIDEYPATFEPQNIHQIDEYYMANIHQFRDFHDTSHLQNIYETEMNNILPCLHMVNINNYTKKKLIFQNELIKINEIEEKETGELFYCKKPNFDEVIENNNKNAFQLVMNYFYFEVSNSYLLSHPSLLNFVGYSPTNYIGKPIPMSIYQYATNGSLDDIIKMGNKFIEGWDDTAMLIVIYGIASCLSYLHSKGNIHYNLNPGNIFLDEFFFPKITGVMIYQNQSDFCKSTGMITLQNSQYYHYRSPEVMEHSIFDKSVDIYSFGMIVYSIISKEIPFGSKGPFFISDMILRGIRPEFKDNFPKWYQKLVEQCWSQNPEARLTADEIVFELKTNPEFISENIDKEKYHNYIKFIEDSLTSKESNSEELFKMKDYSFLKVRINKEKQRKNFSLNIGSINLDNFEKKIKIGSGSFGNVYKVLAKETGMTDAAKVSKYDINECDETTIVNFEREIQIISKLNFPSILKFVGYSPINFKNQLKPVVITELISNGTLGSIIELERMSCANKSWDDTKKLINIYGIAAGMNYLHQLKIVHRDLKPDNILMDEFLFPKIADFGLSKHITSSNDENYSFFNSGLKGTYAYCAPEILKDNNYTFAGDVYAFGIIVYEIMTSEVVYKGLNQYQLFKLVIERYRPEFRYPIADCYQELIEKCWNEDYNSRPTFEEIVELLETDRNFITENVDEDEYLDYISYVKGSISANENKEVKCPQFNKVTIDTNQVQKEDQVQPQSQKESIFNDFFLDLSKYERGKIISKSDNSKLYKVKDKSTKIVYQGEISIFKVDNVSKEEMAKFVEEVKVITQMDHPTFLKLIGYSPVDFKNNPNPTVISELCLNNTLKDIFELERKNKKLRGWDDTRKLINLYGIASGMAYLHSHGILHRNLRLENIFLDDYLFPKIGNFGLLTRFLNPEMMSHQSMTGLKCTPIYSSPEVLQTKSYSKASDVYSFAFIVFQVVTGEIPFSNLSSSNQVFNEVVLKGERPHIKEKVPMVYQELIKRCWSEDPNERPTFKEISNLLKTNTEFITDKISQEDYFKYIKEIDQKLEKKECKINSEENAQKIEESYNSSTISVEEAQKVEENTNDATILIEKAQKVEENDNSSTISVEEAQKVEENDNNSTTSMEEAQRVEEVTDELSNKYTENHKIETTDDEFLISELNQIDVAYWKETNPALEASLSQESDLAMDIKDGADSFPPEDIRESIIQLLFNDADENSQRVEGNDNNSTISIEETQRVEEDANKSSNNYTKNHSKETTNDEIRIFKAHQSESEHVKEAKPAFEVSLSQDIDLAMDIQDGADSFSPEEIQECIIQLLLNDADENLQKVEESDNNSTNLIEETQKVEEVTNKTSNDYTENYSKEALDDEIQIIKVHQSEPEHVKETQPVFKTSLSKDTNLAMEIQDGADSFRPEEIRERTIQLLLNDDDKEYSQKVERDDNNSTTSIEETQKVEEVSNKTSNYYTENHSKEASDDEIQIIKVHQSEAEHVKETQPVFKTSSSKDTDLAMDIQDDADSFRPEEIRERTIQLLHNDDDENSQKVERDDNNSTTSIEEVQKAEKNDNNSAAPIEETQRVERNDNNSAVPIEETQRVERNDNNSAVPIEEVQKAEKNDNNSTTTIEETQRVERNDNNSTTSIEEVQKAEEVANESSNDYPKNHSKEAHNDDIPIIKVHQSEPEHVKEAQPAFKTSSSKDTNLSMGIQDDADTSRPNEIRERAIPLILNDDEHSQKVHGNMSEKPPNDTKIIEEYISSRNAKDLMVHLHNNSDFEKTSSVFDRCFSLSKDFYVELCKEGMKRNNAVAHHKYALHLIYQQKKYDEAVPHLKKSIEQGFTRSYFSLSRLLQSRYQDDKRAFEAACEGMKKGDKYCQCLFGYFTAKGVGTQKDHSKGVEEMLKSEFNDFYEHFPTDIGIYFSKIEGREKESFRWFERAFKQHQTKVTINNYGVCFLRGFGTEKNLKKALEIFQLGAVKNDSNSMYHIGFILEETDPNKSLEYYKKAAEQGFAPAQLKYSSLQKGKDQNESQFAFGFMTDEKDSDASPEYQKRIANNDNVKSPEILSTKSSSGNDAESTYKYMIQQIQKGNSKVPLKYAIGLYRSKNYKQAYSFFEYISKTNNPVAEYYLAVMHYYGQGCIQDRDKAYEMMTDLSKKGIDKATDFLEEKY
ncbi:hypothetical protein M9Y10_036809 [Tritrichomonas musculus]|uniref:Protein kinase domain-containing protein n=1 Tax=Tritrichomonas musculus TaxID=1915356 RepID=A0ABR2GUP4_9EUKA